MTTRHTSLVAAIVAVQQHDGVAFHAVHLIAKVGFPVDLWHGTRTQHHNVCLVLTAVTRLASVEQHGPRGDDGVGHQHDGLPGRIRLHRDLSLLLSLTPLKVRHDGHCQRDDLLHHSLALPEVRHDGHCHNVLLDNVLLLRCVERRTVRVGRIGILVSPPLVGI